jgi:hypothetical protein
VLQSSVWFTKLANVARLYSQHVITAENLLARVSKTFANTPLVGLVVLFEKLINTTDSASKGRALGLEAIASYLDFCDRLFTSTFKDRFDIDSWLMRDLLESWNVTDLLKQNVVPVYAQEWSYTLLPPPAEQDYPLFVLYVVTFPGRDSLEEINLLRYPWLWHELGHHILADRGSDFTDPFSKEVERAVANLNRKSIADSAKVKEKYKNLAEQLRTFWTPRANQYDWGQEITVDVIALWTCGPAYLAAFTDVVENNNTDPFLLSPGHPPYEVRALILSECAQVLGWFDQASSIKKLVEKWRSGKWASKRNNDFLAVVNDSLMQKAATLAMEACDRWNLPKCTPQYVEEVRKTYLSANEVNSAIELIIASWLKFEASPERYASWQLRTLQNIFSESNCDAGSPV